MPKQTESIRLFENPFLESMTHVHPIIPLVMWGPLTIWFFFQSYTVDQLTLSGWFVCFSAGMMTWTLTEYAVHRYLFHYPAQSEFGKRLVYLFHGIHHDQPDDATRLVMPPVPAIILLGVFYGLFSLVVPEAYLNGFMGFFIAGYLCYDYIHYATHHFPMKSKVGSYLRKYHLRHHHAKEESKYGVSNPFWDYALNTVTGPKKVKK